MKKLITLFMLIHLISTLNIIAQATDRPSNNQQVQIEYNDSTGTSYSKTYEIESPTVKTEQQNTKTEPEPSVSYFQVTKLWANDDESTRPESIEVTLLENNTPIDTIELSENNNWTYTWTELDMTKKYTIIENTNVPGYMTEYKCIDKAHVNIINTYDDEIPEEPDPEEPDPDKPEETQPKIPETGSTGIIPILLLGTLFIIIGVKITKN